jgi:anthranilate phosphoribosyltransferase
MKQILNRLFEHKTLSRQESEQVLTNIATGQCNNSEIAAFISVYLMRSITVDELAGFRDALLNFRVHVDLSEFDTIDLCGTGGDKKDTFNISTLASFVVAGAGVKVAKHGNYAVSSTCGSSNVMEFLGYHFSNDQDKLRHEIDVSGICFLHAPLFNAAMKNVAPVRKELGVKTFFNMLGPMVNPSLPKYQMVGVFSLEVARMYNYLYQQLEKQFIILHSLDGYDEVSLTGGFKIITNEGEYVLLPEDLGFDTLRPEELYGGKTVEDSAKIFMDVLEGKSTSAQANVVVANAGLALKCVHPEKSYMDCISEARESLVSKKALNALKKLIN